MFKHIAFFLVSLICLNLLDNSIDTISLTKNWSGVLIFLLALTAINWIILPLFKFITFPFNFITFGLVNFLINLGGIWLAIKLTSTFTISGNGLDYLFNLFLISITLTASQIISNKLVN